MQPRARPDSTALALTARCQAWAPRVFGVRRNVPAPRTRALTQARATTQESANQTRWARIASRWLHPAVRRSPHCERSRPVTIRSGGTTRAAPHQAHGAAEDDGVVLRPAHHGDVEEVLVGVEEPGEVAVVRPVAVVLRGLHEGDRGVGEVAGGSPEEAWLDQVVGVDHGDHL